MTCEELIKKLEERWNPSYAMDWDNVGLLVGRREKEVHKIFVALDVTDETLDQALAFGADLMVTHHPFLFSPMKKITTGDFMGRRLIRMIQRDLSYFAMHTNFDVMGMADLNGACLGLSECQVLEVTGLSDRGEEGIGRVGSIKKPMALKEYAGEAKKALQVPDVRVYGDPERIVKRVAVCGGSGKSTIPEAVRKGADVLVTGDIDYHSALDAVADGLCVIDAGHYGTEYCFIDYVVGELKQMFPELEVSGAVVRHPYQLV